MPKFVVVIVARSMVTSAPLATTICPEISAPRTWLPKPAPSMVICLPAIFSADDSEKGINLPYIKLAVLRPDTIPALVTEVLQKQANLLWYLNSRGDNYYFSKIPNLNRMILDKKELYNDSYEEELRRVVEAETGSKFRAYVWPETADNIPDNRDLKLLILRPEDRGEQIAAWMERSTLLPLLGSYEARMSANMPKPAPSKK